jgi:hypothetical protein
MVTNSKTISPHFHSTEFRCKCGCGKIYIDENLVNKLEKIFSKLNASKCIISSGYRCPKHDKNVGGNGYGQHTKGTASDCIYYDKNGKIIPSKIVICVAYDSNLFRGIAKIDNNYTHLDIRTSGYYKGDETVSNNSVWTNPYDYFKVSKEDVAKYTGETIKVYKTISNCYWLNLRTSASYGNNIYKAVKAGTKVEYLGLVNDWAKIKFENRILYCRKNYLK